MADIAQVSENPVVLPEKVELDELHALPLPRLIGLARSMGIRYNSERSRHYLILDLLRFYAGKEVPVFAEGVLELAAEHHGFLRWPRWNFKSGPEDVYISQQQIKAYGLRGANKVRAKLRMPRDREKYVAAEELLAIEGMPLDQWQAPKDFEALTPMFPRERIILENDVTRSVSARALDLVTPLGRGQRGLIVAPPRTGKTLLLKDIALAIEATSPQTPVLVLLIDERPEEVTDLKRSLSSEVYSSTFDEAPTRHVQVAELVCERAKRLVEQGKHVVILLDSITRLARGYNALQGGKGRTMSGGVDSKGLLKPKRFFGSARNVEEGGSLTILATALIETESRMDQVIFEEFKGTGNMELHLDRTLTEMRLFPAINIINSGTRREDLLYHPDEHARIAILRRQLAELPAAEAMELLLNNLKATKTNTELLLTGLR